MTRTGFRFCIVYFGLYSAATQILGGVLLLPGLQLPALGNVWPMRDVTLWIAEHIVGLTPPLRHTGNSGDTAFHWIQTGWLLLVASAGTAIWSAIDRPRSREAPRRDRPEHTALRKWFRVFVRFALAAQMFYYGMAKVIPTQFPPPGLVTLIEPVGSASLSDLLWTFIGASTPYQMVTG